MSTRRRLRLGLVVCLSLALPARGGAQTAHTKWYLAEGNAGYFDEEILAVNPTAQDAVGVIHILRNGAPPTDVPFTVPKFHRITMNVKQLVGDIGDASAAIEVTNGVPIFVERSMYWNNRNAGTNAPALEVPSKTWYLAEGAANGFFDTFVLLANPNSTTARVELSLQKDDGSVYPLSVTLPGNQRRTVYVNQLPNFGNASFSTLINSDQAIFAERSMYWNRFTGGHDSTAVTAPTTTWLFAEGFTGSGFDTFFLLNNPGDADTNAILTFFLDTGATVAKQVTVAAHSRLTVRAVDYPELVEQAFATKITSDAPIVAERAMYWGVFKEGHATGGLTAEANSFAFAEGVAGRVNGIDYETFFLFANASNSPIDVRGTFYREDGTGNQQTFTIPAHSRFTLYGATVPDMNNQRFAAMFQSVNTSRTFIVERAVYWSNRAGGTVSTGTPWHDQVVAPPAVPPPPPPPPPPTPDPPPPPPPPPPPQTLSFGAGTHLVNQHITPGRYFARNSGGCYWERQSGLSGSLDDILANNFIPFASPQTIVDIRQSDLAFMSDADCNTWSSAPTSGAISAPAPGWWLVGSQLRPGTYATQAAAGCYWERLRGFDGSLDAIIDNDFISAGGLVVVTISSGDVGFDTEPECGTWTAVSQVSTTASAAEDAPTRHSSEQIEANRKASRALRGH